MPHHKREDILGAATAFCDSFAQKNAPADILCHFSASEDIVAYEHGLPELAPFLGREFKGRDGIKSYFETISSCLSYENMQFSNYIVDEVENKVSVRGAATFTWTTTAESWAEVFTYVLAFDEHYKVTRYEIWADSGAAYLASKGELKHVRSKPRA
ncbi:hypothetical protein F4779DRAFT_160591 [Xylariaceae sp. FL0662B]|nr:hypothetical protein F4779DRAFT_160591 [Xylariaceae sp. FL0662B]